MKWRGARFLCQQMEAKAKRLHTDDVCNVAVLLGSLHYKRITFTLLWSLSAICGDDEVLLMANQCLIKEDPINPAWGPIFKG